MASSDEEREIPTDEKFYHFNCTKCKKVPILQIVDKYKYKVDCRCSVNDSTDNIEEVDIKDLKKKFITENEKFDEEEVFVCQDHSENYKEYCQTCKKYLCDRCEKICNEYIYLKQNLDNKNIEEPIKFLKKLFDKENSDINESKDDKILKEVVNIIIEDYHRGKNLNLYTCIINLYTFFFKDEYPTISSPYILQNLNKNVLDKIIKIDIYQYFFDLNILEKNFPELKELILRNNNIDNLEFLTKGEFPKLEILYLDINKINDKVFDDMEKFNCKNLKEFSLKQNYISNYRIFEEVQKDNFKYLKKLDISSNKFKDSDKFFKSETKIKLDSIEQLIVSNGVFDENSIKNISKISLKNLKKIDLSSNNIDSLKFINDVEWPEIEEIILNDNDIKYLEELKKFQKNKKELLIVIENNLIENEDEINNIINDKIKIKYQLCSELIKDDQKKSLSNNETNY